MHLLGGMRRGQTLDRLLRYLGISDKLRIKHVDALCMDQITYLSDGKTYRVPEGREAFIRYFAEQFPHEREAIEQYVEALYRSEEHTSELQSRQYLVCRLLLEKK